MAAGLCESPANHSTLYMSRDKRHPIAAWDLQRLCYDWLSGISNSDAINRQFGFVSEFDYAIIK
jgi:hypothetical protein